MQDAVKESVSNTFIAHRKNNGKAPLSPLRAHSHREHFAVKMQDAGQWNIMHLENRFFCVVCFLNVELLLAGALHLKKT